MNYRMITYTLGWILLFEAGFMTVPLVTAAVYLEGRAALCFGVSILICLVIGGLLALVKKPVNKRLYSREGFVIVSFSWILLSLFGAFPFWISGEIPSFVDALFETVSGFTTTGASVVNNIEGLSRSMIMWRCFTHWVGGMGVLVFIMAFLPLSGGQNMHIMKAESPGPSVSKLVPKVKTTALILYAIYFVLTVVEFILLLLGDMTPFDALNIAFSTAGTGGFGMYNDSMASFSPYIQIVVTVFMLLFSVNFSSFFFLLVGKFREAFNTEVVAFFSIVTVTVGLITLNILPIYNNFGESLRYSAFAVSSVISTTGFSTQDFNLWPELSRMLLVLVSFVGACAGSTAGGIKVSRIVILFKNLGRELQIMVHPRQIKKITIDKRPVEHEVVRSVNVYMVAYVLLYAASMLLITFDGFDFTTNFSAVCASINNVGVGIGMVGPASNFGIFSAASKLVLIFDMLAGRLELFPILLLFVPVTWKK